jgi:hypothetical protein
LDQPSTLVRQFYKEFGHTVVWLALRPSKSNIRALQMRALQGFFCAGSNLTSSPHKCLLMVRTALFLPSTVPSIDQAHH